MTLGQIFPIMGNSISIIIPTLDANPITLEPVPDSITDVHVVSEGNRSEARNIGARRAENELLIFLDDDVTFSEDWFWEIVESMHSGEVVGVEDFTHGLLLTRFLAIYNQDFQIVGEFDEKLNHMEDTEFSLRALSHGMKIKTIPRDSITHFEHKPVGKGMRAFLWGYSRICLKHPRYIPFISKTLSNRLRELGIKDAIQNIRSS